MARVFEAERMFIDVKCEHPDTGSEYHHFALEEDNNLFKNDEELRQEEIEIRKQIENKVNECGYWHHVYITLVWHIEGKEYHREI